MHRKFQNAEKIALKVLRKEGIKTYLKLAIAFLFLSAIGAVDAQPINEVAENGFLDSFGFDSIFVTLETERAILKSKKTGHWGVYSTRKFERANLAPEKVVEPIYDSVNVLKIESTGDFQYFFYRNGKVGYSPYTNTIAFKDKIRLDFDEIEFIADSDERNKWSVNLDHCFGKKNGKWGIYAVSYPALLYAQQHVSKDSLPAYPYTFSVNKGILFIQKSTGSKDVMPLPEEFQPESFKDSDNAYLISLFYLVKSPKNGLWGIVKFDNRKGKSSLKQIFNFNFSEIAFEMLGEDNPSVLGRQGEHWARYHFHQQYPMTGTNYSNKDDVPKIYLDEETHRIEQLQKQHLGADIIEFDWNNGDGVFKARIEKSKKWGMYQKLGGNTLTTLIPAAYDSISFFEYNAKFTAVWNSGKVGIYLSPWSYGEDTEKQTVPCLYEDYKIFNVEKSIYSEGYYRYGTVVHVAVKKNGRWAWIDWMTGELKSDFLYDLETEKMPFPEFEQIN